MLLCFDFRSIMKIYWTYCVHLKINLLSAFEKTLKRALRSVTKIMCKWDFTLIIYFGKIDWICFWFYLFFSPDCRINWKAGVVCWWDGWLFGAWKFCTHCGLHSNECCIFTLTCHLHHHSRTAPRDWQVSLFSVIMTELITFALNINKICWVCTYVLVVMQVTSFI